MIRHVWERCRECRGIDRVLVATDDPRIAEAVRGFGGEAVMTSDRHETGTDRIAEAVASDPDATHILNIQGDEPLIDPALIGELAARISAPDGPDMVTAACPLDPADPAVSDPDVVKVVTDLRGRALYFSRSPLPYFRVAVEGLPVMRHKGVYGYRRGFLRDFVAWPQTPLERAESLEQLRALENGASVLVVSTEDRSPGVDTPAQAAMIEAMLSGAPGIHQ